MVDLPNTTLTALILFLHGIAFGFVAPSPQTLFRRFPSPPTATLQANSTGQAPSFANSCRPSTSSHASTITAAPSLTHPPWCLLGESLPGCITTKTWDALPIPELPEQCILWNSSCCGDRTAIAAEFFNNTLPIMEEKPCWKMMDNASIPCTQYESPEILSAMREVKSWMRTPDCASMHQDAGSSEGCCGLGYINAKNVDVYYWPEPDSNTACLSIVGNTVHPSDYGATTDMGLTYWGCTASNPKTSTTISDINGPSGYVVSSTTIVTVHSIITTAQITMIGSVAFKQSLVNPWTPAACIQETSTSNPASVPTETHASQAGIHARGHSLLISSSMTRADGLPVSTVVSGAFTL